MKNAIRLIMIVSMIITAFTLWLNLDMKESKEKAVKNNKIQEVVEKDMMVSIDRSDGTKLEEPLEEYLVGVVASEMPVTFELEALKAQAVAARTFVMQRGLKADDTTSSQVYKSEDQLKAQWLDDYDSKIAKIREAVNSTKGEVLTYDGAYISAVFFSSSCGKTNNGKDYWGSDTAYLVSVDSPWDLIVNDGSVQEKAFSTIDLANKLGFQSTVTQIGVPTYFDSGYVKDIKIDGIVFSGREIREKLGLRSNSFKVDHQGSQVVFTTTGFGHGIGMSQYGAQGMALDKKNYKEILLHYYTGVKIEKIKV